MFNKFFKKTRHLNRISAAILLAVGFWVGLVGECWATVVFDDGFESYDISDPIQPGNEWVALSGSSCSILNTLSGLNPYEGNRFMICWASGRSAVRDETPVTSGFFTWELDLENTNKANGEFAGSIKFFNTGITNQCGELRFYKDAAGWVVKHYNGTSETTIDTVTSNTWHYMGFNWDTSSGNSADRWVRYKINGVWTDKVYNPFSDNCVQSGIGSFYMYQNVADGHIMKLSIDDIHSYATDPDVPPYEPPTISITYPTASSTSKAEFWTVDANTNDDTTYDKLYVKIRSASTEACAENTACTSAWVDGNKVIGECDNSTSTYDGTSNVSRLAQIPDTMAGQTIYATAFLYGVTDATCVDGDGPEVPVLLATSSTISFTYSTDYITGLNDADEYWAATWSDRWGAATSTIMYQAVAGGFDIIMGPVVNWASTWSHLFNTADATNAGISAGSGVQILAQHAKDFFNVIPGCQLFAIILIAVIIDIAIYIYKNIYRIKKFFTV